MLKLAFNRPPEHAVDDLALWIHPSDCWDHDRVEAERKRLGDAAVANLPKKATDEEKATARSEAEAKHPVTVWYTGASRFSLDARLTVPEKLRDPEYPASAVTIEAYLVSPATTFEIRSLDARSYRRALGVDRAEMSFMLVKHGLVRIHGAADASGKATVIEPERDASGAITDDWLDMLDRQDRTLLDLLGGGIFSLSARKEGDAEGKP